MSLKRIKINISGEVYETLEKTLQKYPQTLLGNLQERKKHYYSRNDEYFFNRNRSCFCAILYFYQSSGILSCPTNVSVDIFEDECKFFQLPQKSIKTMKNKIGIIFYNEKDDTSYATDNDKNQTIKQRLWNFLENPETSTGAKWFGIVSLLMILVSVITTCLETLPSVSVQNSTLTENPWALIELILNIWFLLELVFRVSTSPNKFLFFQQIMSWFDILAVIPYFIVISFSSNDVNSVSFLRILKIMRVIRLYRLSKHSKRLQVVGNIIKSSISDLQLLLLCLTMLMIFGGSLMYFIEGYDKNTQFNSIPQSLWWGVQTITTVGYGDITPVTNLGKLLASCFMAFGALTISLPVLSIVTKFMIMYSKNVME